MIKRPVILCILDGWGHREGSEYNAIAQARTPTFDALWQHEPHALLTTDGASVGLPHGQMGNSEVGHMTIGSGRVLWQDLPRIDAAIKDGSLAKNPHLQKMIADLKRSGRACHLIGLLSPGGIHSHQNHIAAVANIIAAAGVRVFIHGFLDGRDRPPAASLVDVADFAQLLTPGAPIKVATLIGRYYGMDRDQRWDRIQKAYTTIVNGNGDRFGMMSTGIVTHHALNITDEFMEPIVNGDYTGMKDGDALLMMNFRTDRVRQLLMALAQPGFDAFKRSRVIKFSHVMGMSDYGGGTSAFSTALFEKQKTEDTLGEVLSRHDVKQMRIAETEKYAHVTYFFNAGREQPWPDEDRIMEPSPKVATYDQQPEMSAPEVTEHLATAIRSRQYGFIVVNYANGDMVGHTGNLKAAVAAIETLDSCLEKVIAAARPAGAAVIISADHGNAEEMWDDTSGCMHTQHSLNPVPCIIVNGPDGMHVRNGTLADLAPTVLDIMGLPAPELMTGKSLLTK